MIEDDLFVSHFSDCSTKQIIDLRGKNQIKNNRLLSLDGQTDTRTEWLAQGNGKSIIQNPGKN